MMMRMKEDKCRAETTGVSQAGDELAYIKDDLDMLNVNVVMISSSVV